MIPTPLKTHIKNLQSSYHCEIHAPPSGDIWQSTSLSSDQLEAGSLRCAVSATVLQDALLDDLLGPNGVMPTLMLYETSADHAAVNLRQWFDEVRASGARWASRKLGLELRVTLTFRPDPGRAMFHLHVFAPDLHLHAWRSVAPSRADGRKYRLLTASGAPVDPLDTAGLKCIFDLSAEGSDAYGEARHRLTEWVQHNAVHTLRKREARRRVGGVVRLITAGSDGGYRAEEFFEMGWTRPRWDNYTAPVRDGYNAIVAMVKAKDPGEGRLALVSGPPGTGKTYLLRALAVDLADYAPLVVPPDIAAQVGSPAFITYLRELRRQLNRPVVLLVEDADHLLRARDLNPHGLTALSTILNAADGILGGVLDLRIIATVNELREGDLDPAVVRSGRLASHLRVGLLGQLEVARCWKKIMGEGVPWQGGNGPVTLAEVYRIARTAGWKPGKARLRGSMPAIPQGFAVPGNDFEEA